MVAWVLVPFLHHLDLHVVYEHYSEKNNKDHGKVFNDRSFDGRNVDYLH